MLTISNDDDDDADDADDADDDDDAILRSRDVFPFKSQIRMF